MKLEKIVTIKATLRCMSGLHIGGGDTEMHIGGIDNAVIRHPLTQRPYLPGSSLKGKMRSLLEWRSGAVKERSLSWSDYRDGQKEVLAILQLFGNGGSDQLTLEEAKVLGPTRVSFWDCTMAEDWVQRLDESMNWPPKPRAKIRSIALRARLSIRAIWNACSRARPLTSVCLSRCSIPMATNCLKPS